MRVLFVTARVPGREPRGDQLRAWQHISQLSGKHRITLLAFGEQDSAADENLLRHCERVIYVRRNRITTALAAARSLLSERPLQVDAFASIAMRDQLDQCLATGHFDLLHIQLARLGELVMTAPRSVPTTLDFVDALSVNMLRRAALDRWPISYVARREARLLATYERRLLSRIVAGCISSSADRDALGATHKLALVNNGVDVDRFPWVAPDERPPAPTVLFVGNLGYFPNVDAIHWFHRNVFPQVRDRIAAAQFVLVGARPHRSLHRLAALDSSVSLVGPVADVHPYLARATVSVAPLRAGSGQQLKILEAMAAGTPTVASPLAAAGLDAQDNEHLLVGRDAAHFAGQIVRLLGDRALRARLAVSARALVTSRYTWEQSALALDQLWQRASTEHRNRQWSDRDDCEACWVLPNDGTVTTKPLARSSCMASVRASSSLRTLPGSVAIAFGLIQAARRNANRAPASSPVAARARPSASTSSGRPESAVVFSSSTRALLP